MHAQIVLGLSDIDDIIHDDDLVCLGCSLQFIRKSGLPHGKIQELSGSVDQHGRDLDAVKNLLGIVF